MPKTHKLTVTSQSNIRTKQNKNQKPSKGGRAQMGPVRANGVFKKGGRKSKGLLSTALDVGEGIAGVAANIAGFLPGAIRGVRSMFSLREAEFATPASFASVTNNSTQMVPSQTVDHPTLGIAGTRVYGSQPLGRIILGTSVTPGFFDVTRGIPAVVDVNTIIFNPVALGGPLSIQAYLHDRFVFRGIRMKFTTYVTTGTPGIGTMCVLKDIVDQSVTSFDTCRMTTPNVTFPYRIPKAELDYVYDGPDLFYCDAGVGGIPVGDALSRQDVQFVLKGYDTSGIASDPANIVQGYFDLEYVIDFFDPVAPVALLGSTEEERLAFRELRHLVASRKPPKWKSVQDWKLSDLTDFIKEPGEAPQKTDPSHACASACCKH
jgi:hypothetical protein